MARLSCVAPKFYHPEWVLTESRNQALAEGERAAGERVVVESQRSMKQAADVTAKMNSNSNRLLSTRAGEVQYWQEELDHVLAYVKTELDVLLALQNRFAKGMDSKREIENLTRQCLTVREKRQGIYLTKDELEKQLIKELEVVQGVEAIYFRTQEQIKEQVRLLRKVRNAIEKQMADKGVAVAIDNYNLELRVTSLALDECQKKNPCQTTNSWVGYPNWLALSNELIKTGDRERESSLCLRSLGESLIMQTVNDLERQRSNVDAALEDRVYEVRTNKEKIEDQLRRLHVQIKEDEENMTKLEEAIIDKRKYVKLVTARLDNRKQRVNMELVLDEAHFALTKELETLVETIACLQQRLCATQMSLRGLDRARIELQADLVLCAEALAIDDNEVRLIRSAYIHKYF